MLALLKSIFNLNLPVFRILIAVCFIYIGLSVLLGGFGIPADKNTILFGEGKITADRPGKYDVIFGQAEVDLTGLSPGRGALTEINTIFGSSVIKVNPEVPARINVTAVFASGRLPNGNSVFFGDQTYSTGAFKEGADYVDIKASVVFGSVAVENR